MEEISIRLFWAALISSALTTGAYLLYAFGSRLIVRRMATDIGTVDVALNERMPEAIGRISTLGTWLTAALLTGAIGARWIEAGRPPVSNMWEFTVAFAWGTSVWYLVFERWFRQLAVGAFVQPLTLALLLVATLFPAEVSPLVPALQNNDIMFYHVGSMALAYSAFSVSFGAAVMHLIQGKERRFARLPKASILDEIAYRAVLVGFPTLALGLLLGAYWGNSAWGRYWGWDPKETSSLMTWLIYAAYLHIRNLGTWRGSRSMWILVVGYVAVIFTFYAVNLWVAGLHSYAGV